MTPFKSTRCLRHSAFLWARPLDMNGNWITIKTGSVSNAGSPVMWFHVSVKAAWQTTHRVSNTLASVARIVRNPLPLASLPPNRSNPVGVGVMGTFDKTGAGKDTVAAGEMRPSAFVGATVTVTGVRTFTFLVGAGGGGTPGFGRGMMTNFFFTRHALPFEDA